VQHDPSLTSAVSPETTPAGYWRFYDAVAREQLAEWLPSTPTTILDLSDAAGSFAAVMAGRGHCVIHVDDSEPPYLTLPGAITVAADLVHLQWLRDTSLDAVVAEGGTLSSQLAAETTIDGLHRVLRPGGRLLLCVDSLVQGLSRLADQGRWAELADVPAADVVLVPNEDGSVTRCFWPEDLVETLELAGFAVEWVRPRTVLPRDSVEQALRTDPDALPVLVRTELALAKEREGEPVGIRLVAAAVRR
jgi:SAM-dependent methyltransferase